TAAEICVAEFTVKVAVVPLNFTDVAPMKFVPLIVTLVPTVPVVGEKLVIVGGLVTMKELLLVAVPSGVVTLTGPVVAPAGTVAEIRVDEFTMKVELVALNFTEVA